MIETFELYVHLPFCKQKCIYCDFASYPHREGEIDAYLDALEKEAIRNAPAFEGAKVATLFLGGGTPSVLSPKQMTRLLQMLHSVFPFEKNAEATCEANPGTLTMPFLQALRKGGVNRLSMGAQAFQPNLLKSLGRIHTWEQVEESCRMAREAGFSNYSLDLMFGLPGQRVLDVTESIQKAILCGCTHLSCYSLIVEDGTEMKRRVDRGEVMLPDEDTERKMYNEAHDLLEANGFHQYEISNYARDGFSCRHNIGYWQGAYYLGLGAAAASMLPSQTGAYLRRSNPADLNAYQFGTIPAEEEIITKEDAMFETMMLGLRMTKGVGEEEFFLRHGKKLMDVFGQKLQKYLENGMVVRRDGRIMLSAHGLEMENTILVDLM